MKKNAFTLIELLAVIVILAIIALIATPIVLNIIDDTKTSAQLRSAEFYLEAVEQAIMKENMNRGGSFKPSDCDIQHNGNLDCNGVPVEVEVSGEVPKAGKIEFKDGNIFNVDIDLSGEQIVMDENKNLVFKEVFIPVYNIGDIVTFNPGDGDRTWNVIGEDENTVTLLLTENLGNAVAWYAHSNYNSFDNSYGPKDALNYLNRLTINWDNVDPIDSYNYINNLNGDKFGYQKIEINNGITTITHKDGSNIILEEKSKARLLTKEEILEIASKTNENFTENNLKEYILKNLQEINNVFELTATSADEFVKEFIQLKDLENETKSFQLYFIVLLARYDAGIDTTYDMLLPSYLYQNVNSDDEGYWTLSSDISETQYVWNISYYGIINSSKTDYDSGHEGMINSLRPVITISKSKL